MRDWTEPVSGNNDNNSSVEPSHSDGGRRTHSPERAPAVLPFSDPSSLVTYPFSSFPSCLVARVHWAEIQSLLQLAGMGMFVTCFVFQSYRGYFPVLNFGFSRENYPFSLAEVSLLCRSSSCHILFTCCASAHLQVQCSRALTC